MRLFKETKTLARKFVNLLVTPRICDLLMHKSLLCHVNINNIQKKKKKIRTPQKLLIFSENMNIWFNHRAICPTNADVMANSEDLDGTAPSGV